MITRIDKKMWIKWLVLPALFTFSLIVTSCDEQGTPDIDDILTSDDQQAENAGDALQITNIEFSDDYKVMELSTRLLHDVGGQDLTDSTEVEAKVEQHIKRLINKLGWEKQHVLSR